MEKRRPARRRGRLEVKEILLAILAFFGFLTPNMGTFALPTPTEIPTPMVQQKSFQIHNEYYNYSYYSVQNPRNITLLPNFLKKEDSVTLAKASACKKWINGGFYDTQNKPLGLFISDGQVIGNQIPSPLFNGFLWMQNAETAITTSIPDGEFRFALQTGPVIILDSLPLTLSIQNDQHERRMVAAQSSGVLIFLTVYGSESEFGGPLLADLPAAVAEINQKEHLNITNAINLDGGSASAFSDGETTVSELTPVGSLFCLRR